MFAFSGCKREEREKTIRGALGYNIFGYTNGLFMDGKIKKMMTTWD